ncbi:DUF6950 family protein [Labrys sp. (in: a-proteobacteria)]|uniref:DUF6950 family protein n=1 Tax=Labrys sp. (in: a-proteobacteria) TaxID=1917972 RepID=UPI0039E3216E
MLLTFLNNLARRPFRWGECDCSLAIADWWQLNHGADPAPWLRGAYVDEAGCAALLAAHGHLPRLMRRIAAEAGAARSTGDRPGDFAVIRLDSRWWGAIRTPSRRWAVKAHDGLCIISNCRVVAAWSI